MKGNLLNFGLLFIVNCIIAMGWGWGWGLELGLDTDVIYLNVTCEP